jgi:hypothetical protein
MGALSPSGVGMSLWQAVFGKDPRQYSVMTKEFLKDAEGNVKGLVTISVEVTPQGIKQIPGKSPILPPKPLHLPSRSSFSQTCPSENKTPALPLHYSVLLTPLSSLTFTSFSGSEKEWPADLVILAMGFLNPEATLPKALHINTDQRNNILAEYGDFRTSVDGVFAAGDCRRGQSLVVWAINEGRGVASAVNKYLLSKQDSIEDERYIGTFLFSPAGTRRDERGG